MHARKDRFPDISSLESARSLEKGVVQTVCSKVSRTILQVKRGTWADNRKLLGKGEFITVNG